MGLLDALSNRDGIFALSLLDAAAPKPVRTSIGGGLLSALGNAQAWQQGQEDRAAREAERQQRAAMQAMQMQAMQQQMADAMRQREQMQRDDTLMRQQFQPLPGPTQDGAPLQPRFDPAGMLGQGASPQAVQQLLSLRQAMEKPAAPLMKLAPGEQVFDPSRPDAGPLFGVAPKQDKPAPTELARLLAEMQSLPPGSPARALYEQQIRKATTHAPATSVNVNTPFENEYQKGQGKAFSESMASINAAAFAAPAKLAQLKRMEELLQGVDGGNLAPTGLEIASALNSLGIKVDPKLGNKEAAESLSRELAGGLRQPGTGPMTDKDFENFLRQVPTLSKSAEGRTQIITTMRRALERDVQVARMARDYERRVGRLDNGFFDLMGQFMAQNPVVPQLPSANSGWNIRPLGK